ncbi:hypothetical protein MMC18_002199 [Xylographa bjoerkii]|nr:hypothetical protein [Xylographa bjoerkii]
MATLPSSSQAERAGRPVAIPHPPPLTLPQRPPYVPFDQRIPDPEEPIHTLQQEQMLSALRVRGYFGLATAIYKHAKCKVNDPDVTQKTSWRLIVDDYETGRFYVYLQLCTLPRDVLEALIKNTIMYEMQRNNKIKEYIEMNMTPTHLPAIYANIFCYGAAENPTIRFSPNTNQGPWLYQGRFLAANDLQKVAQYFLDYSKRSPTSDTESVRFDNFLAPDPGASLLAICADPKQRRYAVSPRAKAVWPVWVDTAKRQFATNMNPAKAAVPHIRAPMEVVWAFNAQSRLKQINNNGSTTYLFGGLNCWTRFEMSRATDGQGCFGKPAQLVIFRVWHNETLPQLSEVLASILCSSYSTEGGYNCTQAGEFADPPDDIKFKLNAKLVFETLDVLTRNLDQDSAKQWKRLQLAQSDTGSLKEEVRKAAQELQKNQDKLRVSREKFKTLKEIDDAVDDADKTLWKLLGEADERQRNEGEISELARDIWLGRSSIDDLDGRTDDIKDKVIAHMDRHTAIARSWYPTKEELDFSPLSGEEWDSIDDDPETQLLFGEMSLDDYGPIDQELGYWEGPSSPRGKVDMGTIEEEDLEDEGTMQETSDESIDLLNI